MTQRIFSDGTLEPDDMTLSVAELLRDAAPWGQGFPEPCFDGRFELLDARVLKDVHLKLKLRPEAGGTPIEAIAFHQAGVDWPRGASRHIAYRLAVNDYFDQSRVQLIVEHVADA